MAPTYYSQFQESFFLHCFISFLVASILKSKGGTGIYTTLCYFSWEEYGEDEERVQDAW